MDEPSSTEALGGPTPSSPTTRPIPVLVDAQAMSVDTERLAALAALVLDAEGLPPSSELVITLVTDEEMAAQNRRALGRQGPTDVLAFPIEAFHPGEAPRVSEEGPPLMLGDVLIAPGYVARQAERLGTDPGDELALMVVHGVLHLLGYDHGDDTEAEMMEARERELLARVGVTRR